MLSSTPGPTDRIDGLFDRIAAHDRVPALSEHKWIRRHDRQCARALTTDHNDDPIGYVQAAFHPGGGGGSGHWAIELAVDPEYRTPQVYDALIAAGGDLVPTRERRVFWAWDDALADRLRSTGLRETRRLQRLERPLPVREALSFPPGVRIDGFRIGEDEDAWLTVNNAAFAGHEENGALGRDDLEERFKLDWFDPGDVLMAREEDVLLGSCWTKRHPGGVGEIYIIGVAPHAQGRGLGRALVLRGLEHLHATGAHKGMLYVDASNDAAMWLYTDLGFRAVWSNRQFEAPT